MNRSHSAGDVPELAGESALAARAALLSSRRIQALEPYRAGLISEGRLVPHFDPLDGGAAARLLILLETPGPGPSPLRFVSRDNPTGTARNLRKYLASADIPRGDTVLWNVVPWIVHEPGARNRALRRGELAEGLAALPPLLAALPDLRAVVLAGRPAGAAVPIIQARRPDLPLFAMPHPSPTYVCTSPAVAERIAATLRSARLAISERAG